MKFLPIYTLRVCATAFTASAFCFLLFAQQSEAQSFVAASTETADGTCIVKKARKVLDRERCRKTRQVGSDGKETRSFYQWPSGSKTIRVDRGDETTLNGKPAIRIAVSNDNECVLNRHSGNTFCFIPPKKKKTAQAIKKPAAPPPQQQTVSCPAYIEDLKRKASAVSVSLSGKQTVSAGEPISVGIKLNGARFSPSSPAYLMVTTINDVRFKGRGFVPLPGGTPGPAKLNFAKDRMRAFTPLHARKIPQAINYEIKPYREGEFEVRWAIAAKTPCGEKVLTKESSQKYVVASGASRIVVQDIYDYSRPNNVIISKNGRYQLLVFDNYYQVFDRVNGTKILDRRGMCPDFSPTSRFVAALAGNLEKTCDFYTSGKTQPKFEVIDLVTSEPVARVHPPALWAHGDAFLVVRAKWWKMLQGPGGVYSLLTDDGDADRAFIAEHTDSYAPAMDIDNGLIAVGGRSSKDKQGTIKVSHVYSMINGKHWTRAEHPNPKIGEIKDKGIIRTATAIATNPAVIASHQRYIENFDKVFKHIGSKAELKVLAGRGITHKIGRAEDVAADLGSSERDGRFLTAALTRSKRNPIEKFLLPLDDNSNRSATSVIGNLLQTSFVPANETTKFNRHGTVQQIQKMDLTDDEKRTLFRTWYETMLESIKRDIPNIEKAFSRFLGCWPGGSILKRHISGAWRHEDGARVVWLVHGNCQAMGTVGDLVINHLSLFITENGKTEHYGILVDGAAKQGNRVANAVGSFGLLQSASQNKRTWIPEAQQFLIGYKPLNPGFHAGRYLFIPIGQQLYVVDLKQKTLSEPIKLGLDTASSLFYTDVQERNFIHLSSDGRFGIFALRNGKNRLRGRYVDDEIVIYDRNGYFLATHEGGQYVHFSFKGRSGLYSLSQFARHLERPDYIQRVYREGPGAVPPPKLSAPPRLFVQQIAQGAKTVSLQVESRSSAGLKELKVFRDGFNILRRDIDGAAFSDKLTLNVPAEARWLSVVASDKNGFESVTRKIKLDRQQSAPEGRLFALAVGTDKYDQAEYLGPLNLAVADAKSFLQAARSAKGRYYSDVITRELLDAPDLNTDLTDALKRFIEQAGPTDTIMLHIAGHGLRDKQGNFYLAGKSTMISDLPNTAVLWSSIGALLEGAKSKVVVFLDACHAGAAGDGNATNDDAAAAFLNRNSSIAVIAASKGRQFSEELASLRGGVFTASLRQALTVDRAKTDRNGNNAIELSELYGELKRRVVELTDGRQTPWIARNQLKGEVPLF